MATNTSHHSPLISLPWLLVPTWSVTQKCSASITSCRRSGSLSNARSASWRPLEHTIAISTAILMVCAKLHNMSINFWMRHGKWSEDIARADFAYAHHHDAAVFSEDHADLPTGDENTDVPTGENSDLKNMLGQMENLLREEGTRAAHSSRRDAIADDLWDKGYRYVLTGKNAPGSQQLQENDDITHRVTAFRAIYLQTCNLHQLLLRFRLNVLGHCTAL